MQFARPPNVGVSGYSDPKLGLSGQAIILNTTVFAGVSNPNSVSATVKHINATIYEANVNAKSIGSAEQSNVKIATNANTTLALPVEVTLASSKEVLSNAAVFQDVAKGCGWDTSNLNGLSGLTGQLTRRTLNDTAMDYTPSVLAKRANKIPLLVDIKVKVSVLSITFSIPVNNVKVSVDCPDLNQLLSSAGGATGGTGIGGGAASAASSLLANNPTASSAAQAGNTGVLSSLLNAGGMGGGAASGINSLISAGSMPIRRVEPTAVVRHAAIIQGPEATPVW